MTKRILTCGVWLGCVFSAGELSAQIPLPQQHCRVVREVPAQQLNDVAMASMDNHGELIYFNPMVVQMSGPFLAAFFHAHEYGHICLNHVQAIAADPWIQSWVSPQLELAADCYATRFLRAINPQAVQAAYQYFLTQGPVPQRPTHPAGTVRAQNIVHCYNTP